jgi:DNA topoisomerase I
MKPLLIVESPSKCATIEKYLASKDIKCVASFGHIREIKSLKDIDIDNNFKTNFTPIASKNSQIQTLKKAIKACSEVILATDNDREGEAIAWHICQQFHLNIHTTKRIIFNEITQKCLIKAYENPVILNMNLVNAQMARQIMDFIVGFKVSPLLWKLGNKNLSAGRCQSPALRLICENDVEGENKNIEKSYNVTGYFTSLNIPFTLNKSFSKFEGELEDYFDQVEKDHKYNYSIKRTTIPPPTPFSTSTIQQTASNQLHYSPKETMSLCQKLYEKGLITYMRTESTRYSEEFIITAHQYIRNTYDSRYINIHQKSQEDQETAHEAIRVTNISKPNVSDMKLEKKEETMYKFIWNNTIESCMLNAIYDVLTAKLEDVFCNYYYSYKCDKPVFLGWQIIKNNVSDNFYDYLSRLQIGSKLNLKKAVANVSIGNQHLHYSEAKLVSTLEKKGIGRPSTFASIVDKIQDRKYVKKGNIKGKKIKCNVYELDLQEETIDVVEKEIEIGNENNKLILNPLGKIVNSYLQENFEELFDYNYTNKMENALDDVANGKQSCIQVCFECNNKIERYLKSIKSEQFEYKFNDNHIVIFAKYGPVVKCIDETKSKKDRVSFKKIKEDIDFDKLQQGEYQLEEILEENNSDTTCPKNEKDLGLYKEKSVVIKKGKFGLYVVYGTKNVSLKSFGNRPIENISLDEVIPILQGKTENTVREINENIHIHKGKTPKFPDYIFYKTKKMKKPSFYSLDGCYFDYKTCDIEKLKEWIKNTHGLMC